METEVNNPLLPGEKRIPGFSRYAIDKESLSIRNIMTEKLVKADDRGRVKIFNDEGVREWFKPNEETIKIIFEVPEIVEPVDNFTKEIIPANSPVIAPFTGGCSNRIPPNIDCDGNVINAAKNSKKGLTDNDIRELRVFVENSTSKSRFREAGEKYGVSLEHARRIWKRQYFPNVI